MHRSSFYEIPPEGYLFPELTRREVDVKRQLEEPVRQWCAFELIRAYGFLVTDMMFEHIVNIGSKRYRIDILILQQGKPWAVVECKEPNHKKMDAAIEQAISYGLPESIGAEFVIATNGNEWIVQRKINRRWIPVFDLPRGERYAGKTDLICLLQTLDVLLPILHVLDEPLEGKKAERFLELLQFFFHGENHVTQGVDERLRNALDNLLRALTSPRDDTPYQNGKLRTAHQSLERFRRSTAVGYEIDIDSPSPYPIYEILRSLHHGAVEMATAASGIDSSNALALRLMATLLQNGTELFDPHRPSDRIEANVHNALREFLSFNLAAYLDLKLPDPVDRLSVDDLKSYTSAAWDRECVRERFPNITFLQMLKWAARDLFSKSQR